MSDVKDYRKRKQPKRIRTGDEIDAECVAIAAKHYGYRLELRTGNVVSLNALADNQMVCKGIGGDYHWLLTEIEDVPKRLTAKVFDEDGDWNTPERKAAVAKIHFEWRRDFRYRLFFGMSYADYIKKMEDK